MIKIVKTIFLLSTISFSQVEISGYIESESDIIAINNQDYTFGYNKIRLDLTSRPNTSTLLATNINGYFYYGDKRLNLLDFIPEKFWRPVLAPDYNPDSTHITYIPFDLIDTLFVDNLYIRHSNNFFDFTIGRQPISLGTGYAWNPIDIFNKKDIVDPTYEQKHVTAVRFEVPAGNLFDLDIIYTPENNNESERSMIQFKKYISGFDLTFNLSKKRSLLPYWTLKDFNKTHRVSNFYGGSIVGQLFDLGLWGEALYSDPHNFKIMEYLTGMDHTFENGIYIMAEYYHNSLGADKDELSFIHFMNNYSGESHSLMKDYALGLINYSFNDFVSGNITSIMNINDKSVMLSCQVNWELVENVLINIWYSMSNGERTTEFGIQDKMIRLRLNGYF